MTENAQVFKYDANCKSYAGAVDGNDCVDSGGALIGRLTRAFYLAKA